MRFEDLPSLLHARLQDLRLTQKALCAIMAKQGSPVSETWMSRWATGRATPSADDLETLLDVLGIWNDEDRALAYRITYAPESARPVAPLVLGPQGDQRAGGERVA